MSGIEPANACALCGERRRGGREVSLPADWLALLAEQRDLTVPAAGYRAPLCRACTAEFDHIRDMLASPLDEDARESAEHRRDEMLADLDCDRLIDSDTA